MNRSISRSGSRSRSVVPGEIAGVDELQVEWCFSCGRAGERGLEVELRDLGKVAEMHRGGLVLEHDIGGLQWVCKNDWGCQGVQ